MAEGPRDALVSRNSATTKYPYRIELFAWSYFYPFLHNTGVWQTHTHTETDRQILDEGMYCVSIASRGKNRPYCTRPTKYNYYVGNERRLIANSRQTMKCRLLAHIWTIMLKLHLMDSLSICYTNKFATNTVKNRIDGA